MERPPTGPRGAPNAGSPASETSAKKRSVFLTLGASRRLPPLEAREIGTSVRLVPQVYADAFRAGSRAPAVTGVASAGELAPPVATLPSDDAPPILGLSSAPPALACGAERRRCAAFQTRRRRG